MSLERIVITLKKNGSFRGASAQDHDGLPVPLTDVAVAALFPTLNTAALDAVATLEADKDALRADKQALQAELEAAQAKHAEIEAALADADPKDAKLAAIKATARDGQASKNEKELAAALAEKAAAEAKIAKLQKK